MWLSNSSVGRKFVMALTGAFLVLFVTFHCLMNAVAILWPAAYNSVCEFLGANWYALAGTAVIAVFIVLHIIYALMLTVQNRKARGNVRYDIARKPATVEWSSQNMLVLGIVILAFLVIHLIQFWAKMQLAEVTGAEMTIPGGAGTLFLQQAFETPWTLVVYAIGFVALWFHLNHGFWSMFQSIGWNNTTWMPRLKKISAWWVTIVCALFLVEGVVFTVRAHEKFYLTDATLREQYKEMIVPEIEKSYGAEGAQLGMQIKLSSYEQVSQGLRQMDTQFKQQLEQMKTPEAKAQMQMYPEAQEMMQTAEKRVEALDNVIKLLDYLESADNKPANTLPASAGAQPY